MLFLYKPNDLDLVKYLSFLLEHNLNAFNHLRHWMAYCVQICCSEATYSAALHIIQV